MTLSAAGQSANPGTPTQELTDWSGPWQHFHRGRQGRPTPADTTGGRLWQAALLLANHLLSDATNCDAVARCHKPGSRLIEVGAGLGLVGLALASAVAGRGCSVTLTDCEAEALENLRQEARPGADSGCGCVHRMPR
jgi:2-polyprenyl-3-methyl-5-hydroxy-6-metoxy-1,4-benzoquinol methylase